MPTADETAAQFMKNLEEKYGRTIPEWIALIQGTGITQHSKIVAYLKAEHGMTHGYANTVAIKAREVMEGQPTGDDDLVAAQYSGDKAALKPIYDQLVAAISAFGDDVELAPKKAYVSLRRNKQFGLIQPSTKTRVDVGINLGDVEPQGRLEASGSFNSMVSHRVRLESPDDITNDLVGWLRRAYDEA